MHAEKATNEEVQYWIDKNRRENALHELQTQGWKATLEHEKIKRKNERDSMEAMLKKALNELKVTK